MPSIEYSSTRIAVVNSLEETLFVYNSKYNLWELPGGKVEKDENSREGAVRELLEETGLLTDSTCLKYLASAQYLGREGNFQETKLYYVDFYKTTQTSVVGLKEVITRKAWVRSPDFKDTSTHKFSQFAHELVMRHIRNG